ncbi:SOS response-associated peptidase family protein, partial [Enterococcus faecium]|uniref:SOS response-associated peptidase family protein n=1 Tax=Enterococcus faecium TaxID=1352 RepID=UPI003F43A64A
WGLIPSWAKDPSRLPTLINARSETAADKPSFRGAMRHRRCLIPADGFYEWTGTVGSKVAHLIQLAVPDPASGHLMAFAGV